MPCSLHRIHHTATVPCYRGTALTAAHSLSCGCMYPALATRTRYIVMPPVPALAPSITTWHPTLDANPGIPGKQCAATISGVPAYGPSDGA